MCGLRRLYYTSKGFDLLASLKKKCYKSFTKNEITKQLAFLIISSSPSRHEKYCTTFQQPLVVAESPYFHGLWYFQLSIVKLQMATHTY